MPTFDEVLEEAGEFGSFQKRVFLLLCLTGITFAFSFAGIVFLGRTPENYWCRSPGAAELSRYCGWTPREEWNYTAPAAKSTAKSAECQRYDVEWNSTSVSCVNPLLHFSNNSLDSVPLTACQDDWVYEETHTTIISEYNLVCASAWRLDFTQAILNLGFLTGAFTLGYGADRYGRKTTYLISAFGVGICGIAVAFAPNFPVFALFRFLQGLFGKGTWMTCYVIVTELVGLKQRRIVGIVIQMFFTLGVIILPGLAYLIPTWQGLQLAISLPNFLFLLYYWLVPESPRWLLTRQKKEKALEIMNNIANQNGKCLTPNCSQIDVADKSVTNPAILDLFRTPQMRKCTLILMYAWFTSSVVYQGLIMRLGIVSGSLYTDFITSAIVELPAAILILLTIDRIGRCLPFALSNFVAGVACLITAFISQDILWINMVIASLGRLGITMAFEIVYFVNTELYPTTLRNFGVSLCSGMCDFGGIISPFLLFRLAAVWLELPLIIFGILAIICGGLVLLLPETMGVPLPETVEDVEKLSRRGGKTQESALICGTTGMKISRSHKNNTTPRI
ncbi:solute carrier family 22 member 3 isoform X2 [Rhinatrema bivittatum]|uniref:solute carrier family 22 member 3 isoform X2 n=1 Tax=Rhinatrema bivittatum TaxID=194408 RepID=UPI00112EFA2E|nr:solute carrier family 22 member 3 isoform X2 [Rhinatrema bivittatum]